jgi:glutamine synthetase
MKADDVLRLAEEQSVRFVRLQFTDILGILKNMVISRRDLPRALAGAITFDGSSIDGFVRIEESDMVLKADPATWSVFPWSEPGARTARLICDVCHTDGRPFEGCPRLALKRVIAEAQQLGYTLQAGPEAEFFLFQTDEHGRPTTQTHDKGTYFDLSPVDKGEMARRDMVLALEEMGFRFEASHHENSPGQHEIRFAHAEALATADNLVTFRHVVRRVAARNGLHATFMPKPIYGFSGSGMHIHLSLHKDGRNAFEGKPLSPLALHFIAGLLQHARGMTAVINPLVNSYKRLVPGYEAPVYIAWSERNRSPLVRVPAADGAATRIELRSPDPACNPYLALAVILQAGLHGVRRKLPAPPPVNRDIYRLTPEERRHYGVEMLPRNLLEAVGELERNEVMKAALGEHIVARYIEAKRVEWEVFHGQVHEWELEEYLSRY